MPKIPVARMYKITVLLLIFVVAATSYFLRIFPYSVIEAALACSIFELALQSLYFKKELKLPYTAIITGVVIGVVASSNAPILLMIFASLVAMLSKSFIRVKGTNIFNPAVIGLLVCLLLFRAGDDWWIAGPFSIYGVLIVLTPLLIICAYESRRLITGASFAITSFVITLIMSGTVQLAGIWTAIIGINYFLAFVMVSEPKTSPNKKHVQVIYGVGVAVLVSLLVFLKIPYPLLFPVLIGNIVYLIYRVKSGSR